MHLGAHPAVKSFCLAVLLLILANPAAASDLKVATWNLEWLTRRPQGDPALPHDVTPKRAEDMPLLSRYVQMLDADVVALQEVDGPEAATPIFPPDRWNLFFTNDSVVQRVGFAVRRGLTVERNPDLVALAADPRAPHRLRSGADITVLLAGARLRLLAIHLKTGCNEANLGSASNNCRTLRAQVAPLQGWIAQRRNEGVPFVILGDFNRVMDGPDELLAALNTAAPLSRATEGRSTPCWGGNTFIDHILAGGPARAWMRPETMRVLVYRETDRAMQEHLSDHCPVSVKFSIPE